MLEPFRKGGVSPLLWKEIVFMFLHLALWKCASVSPSASRPWRWSSMLQHEHQPFWMMVQTRNITEEIWPSRIKHRKKNMCWNTACLPREGHGILPFLLLLQKRPHKIFLPIERDIFCIHQEKDLQCYVTFSSTYTVKEKMMAAVPPAR